LENLFLLNSPYPLVTLIKRELLTSLRSWKSFFLLLVMLLLLLYFASETMEASVVYTSASAAMREFFQIQIWCLYLMAMAVVPAMAAVAVNSEHETGNWDLLTTSLIPPWCIVLGKYIAVLVYFVLYGVAILPLSGLVYFYAGVDVHQFFDAMNWIVPAALCNAAIGLWASSTCAQPAQSIVRTFITIFLLGATITILGFLQRYFGFAGFNSIPVLSSLSSWSWASYGVLQLLAGALFLSVTMYSCSYQAGRVMSTFRIASDALHRTRAKLFSPVVFVIPDGGNPFGYRDLLGSASQNRRAARLLFCAVTGMYFVLFAVLAKNFSGSEAGMGIIERIIILAVVPPLAAIAVSKERDETTLDMYRMTLLASADFYKGKVLGFLRQHRPLLLAVLFCKCITLSLFAADIGLNEFGPPFYVLVIDFITLPIHLLMVICTAISGALFPRATIAAIGTAFGFLFAGILMFLYMQFQFASGVGSSSEIADAIGLTTGHLALCVLALIVATGVGMVRLTALWEPHG